MQTEQFEDDQDFALNFAEPVGSMEPRERKGFIWLGRCYFKAAADTITTFGLTFGGAYAVQILLMRLYFKRPSKWVPGFVQTTSKQFGNNMLLINSTMIGTCVAYSKILSECKSCLDTWKDN